MGCTLPGYTTAATRQLPLTAAGYVPPPRGGAQTCPPRHGRPNPDSSLLLRRLGFVLVMDLVSATASTRLITNPEHQPRVTPWFGP